MGTFSCTIQEVTGVASWGTRLRLAAHGLKIRALRAASSVTLAAQSNGHKSKCPATAAKPTIGAQLSVFLVC